MNSPIRITSVIVVLTLAAGLLTAEEPAASGTKSVSSTAQKWVPQTRQNSPAFAEKEIAFFQALEARLRKWDLQTPASDEGEEPQGLIIDLNQPVQERIKVRSGMKLEIKPHFPVQEPVYCIPCHFLHLSDPSDHPDWYRLQLEQEKLVQEVLKHTLKSLLPSHRRHQSQHPLYFDGLDPQFLESGIALG